MFVLQELYRTEQSLYNTILLGEHSTQSSSGTGSLRQLFLKMRNMNTSGKKVLLLDEQRFSRFATPAAFCAIKPCTTNDMYGAIEPILQKYGGHHAEKLFYHIDCVTINGKDAEYYIGEKGDIRFVLHIIALKRDDRYIAKSVFGRDIEQVRIYPSSFFTLHHIKQSLNKQNGTLLSIGQHQTKRILFKNGMYQTCEVLDLGRQVLKDIYAENNIEPFFDATKSALEANAYAKGLVEQSVQFYVDMLMRWLRSYDTKGDIFLISSIVQNEFFMEMFSQTYQSFSQSFIIPITQITGLQTYGRNRSPEEIDMQTAVHYVV